jgi:hypothetical protein
VNDDRCNIFVDVEARGRSPVKGTLAEFGAVTETLATFHGRLYESTPDPVIPAIPVIGRKLATDLEVATKFANWLRTVAKGKRLVFISDNPGYDYMWIAGMFDRADMDNPFERFRLTPHDHNPVNDATGNREAFHKLIEISETQRGASDGQ